MNSVIYIGHCIHSGLKMDYKFVRDLDSQFHTLPNLYAISVTAVDGERRDVVATILVKTDMGQTKEEIGRIYGDIVSCIPELNGLPLQQVTLRCTKTSIDGGVVPNEDDLVGMFRDLYTLNSTHGSA